LAGLQTMKPARSRVQWMVAIALLFVPAVQLLST
jgi:hypothetical protein